MQEKNREELKVEALVERLGIYLGGRCDGGCWAEQLHLEHHIPDSIYEVAMPRYKNCSTRMYVTAFLLLQ